MYYQKMSLSFKQNLVALTTATVLLSGCGGGGGGSTPAQEATYTGYLVDANISGVSYNDGLNSGVTSTNGSFTYSKNRTITFSIGGVTVGTMNTSSIATDNTIYPTDLAGTARGSINDAKVVQILQLLQTLDSDDNPSNGITITETTRNQLANANLNLSSNTITTTEINTTIVNRTTKSLISETSAKNHFRETLRSAGLYTNTVSTLTMSNMANQTVAENAIFTSTTPSVSGAIGTLTYSLSGTDASLFTINPSTGVVSMIARNFEAPADSGNDNVYNINVVATDSDSNTVSTSITVTVNDVAESKELYLKSVVYDNNRTTSTADDKLYIYFNKAIASSSIITSTLSSNYDINGTGAIGSGSTGTYDSAIFNRHTITLNNSGTSSVAFDTNGSTKLSIHQNTIIDTNGLLPQDYNQTVVSKFNVLARLKTGQTTSYVANDDGATQRGITRSYTRDGIKNTVTDNITGLIWQDDTSVASNDQNWTNAISYCDGLTLGSYTDWRLPTIEELMSIVDKGRIYPAIDPTFANVVSNDYWSSSLIGGFSFLAKSVYFYDGYDSSGFIDSSLHVRCVRPAD